MVISDGSCFDGLSCDLPSLFAEHVFSSSSEVVDIVCVSDCYQL